MNQNPKVDLELLSEVVSKYVSMGRSGLLPALHDAQKIYGWLPAEVTGEVAKLLKIPLSDAFGVVEFYSLFYSAQVESRKVKICTDPACRLRNSENLFSSLQEQFSSDTQMLVEKSPCLGLCEYAPAAMLNDDVVSVDLSSHHPFTPFFPLGRVNGTIRLLTKNTAKDGPTTLQERNGYLSYQKACEITPNEIIAEIKASGLVGRGGAAFPTGIKWEGARNAVAEKKFIVCNADESEPGTFKDRILLSRDPHMVIEGMCIAARAIGANHGYIYLRGEYPYLVAIVEAALAEARPAGYLNESFDIELRVGAGAYICGEETALFESIEGKRGFPRVKPPFPTTNGLFGMPTVINNVETLCNVPLIFELGVKKYRQIGTEKSPGPKLFCLSGDISVPGLYEVEFGVTLREMLDLAGGIAGGNALQAILFGGATGSFATPDHLDVRLTFEDLRTAGLPLGSGVIMVFDQTRDLRDTLNALGHFFAHESCGKCYPCQIGTQRQMEILERVSKGEILPGDLDRLQDVGWTMADASLCGLGQTASSAVLSAIKLFPHLFSQDHP